DEETSGSRRNHHGRHRPSLCPREGRQRKYAAKGYRRAAQSGKQGHRQSLQRHDEAYAHGLQAVRSMGKRQAGRQEIGTHAPPPRATDGLCERTKPAAAAEWRGYVEHPFTAGLADGSLPQPAFRRYLVQDYLFLIEFARAYALAVYKAPQLSDMRESAG